RIVASEQGQPRIQHGLLQNHRAEPLPRAPPQRGKRLDLAIERRFGLVAPCRNRQGSQRRRLVEREQHEIWPHRLEERVRVEHCLAELAIRRELDIEKKAAVESGDANGRNQRLDRRGSENGDASLETVLGRLGLAARLLCELVDPQRCQRIAAKSRKGDCGVETVAGGSEAARLRY